MPEVVEDWFKISGTSVNQIGSTAINTAIPFYESTYNWNILMVLVKHKEF